MKKRSITRGVLPFMAALLLGLSACSSSGTSGGDVTWTWGTFRGLYGDAEVTFNEDGGRDTVVMKYPNGKIYRQLEYDYELPVGDVGTAMIDGSASDEEASETSAEEKNYLSGKAVYPITKYTKDASGRLLYSWGYQWAQCDELVKFWGAGVASDITPILEAGEAADAGKEEETSEERYYSSYEWGYSYEKEASTSRVSYQEMSHLLVSGEYQSTYENGSGYWLTKRVDGNPAKTWFYSPDGRLDENLTITWNYEKNKPVSLQLGQYSADTYTAEVSDDGNTVTYTLDESHTGESLDGTESKDLAQISTFTLTRNEDGMPVEFRYDSSKEYMNEDAPVVKQYCITCHYTDSVLSDAEYYVSSPQEMTYTITCNAEGMLETEDNLRKSIGSGDIGAKAYTYYESGAVETVTAYRDFTTEDPSKIQYVRTYGEGGWLSGETYYRTDGTMQYEETYYENGEMASKKLYSDGQLTESGTYNEKGLYTSYEEYRSDGSICRSAEMTGENELTLYGYKQDEANTKYISKVFTYGEDSTEVAVYNDDGTLDYTYTYDEKSRQI